MIFRCWTVTAILCIATIASAGEHWPGWRGPTGMGLSDEKNLPLTWGGKAEENVLWKAPLFPSEKVDRDHNQSSPIVWGDRVFVTVSYWPEGRTRKEFSEHHVVCFSTKDGKQLWDTPVKPGPWLLNDFRGGGYTCATPATDGQRVYAVFGSSVIAALDFKGEVVWHKEIKPYKFDVALAASPVIFEDKVILVCDQTSNSSTIYAFDGKTGDVRWESKRPKVNWSHSTPVLAKVGDKMQLITATHNGPQGIDPVSGEPIWSYHDSKQIGDTVSPTVRDGICYVDSGRGGNPGVAIDVTGSGDVSKTALKWKVANVSEGFSSPVLVDEYLYRLHSPGVISCWKWASGAEVYRNRLEGIETACSPIATADGRIYCVSGGRSYVLKAGPTFEVLAKNEIGDANRSSPAVAAGRLYIKGGRYLYCIGQK